MKYNVDFSSKCVLSVKFSICESKKVAVQPYSGDELCSAISWKRYGIWNWHHSMQNLMLTHLWMDFHGPSKSKKYIMSSVSGALFTITAMCAKDTHAHSCHSRVVLHFARPWYPVIRFHDFMSMTYYLIAAIERYILPVHGISVIRFELCTISLFYYTLSLLPLKSTTNHNFITVIHYWHRKSLQLLHNA